MDVPGDPLQMASPSADETGEFMSSNMFAPFKIYVLKENVRQQTDRVFFDLLCDLRVGKNLDKLRCFLETRRWG
jgi:hypothetical protein